MFAILQTRLRLSLINYKFVEKCISHRENRHLPNHRFGISVTILLFEGTRIYRYRDLFHCECLDVYYPHIIHQSKISNCFLLDPFLYSCRAGNDSHNRNGKRYIVMHISYKMNVISVVIYCYDWIGYLCGVIEIFIEYQGNGRFSRSSKISKYRYIWFG